ncbi:MAG: hypothetical protein HUU20_16010, partial [Pirellulales bacterium]|nr:hypothetical protein [Pirellulales bacterium]
MLESLLGIFFTGMIALAVLPQQAHAAGDRTQPVVREIFVPFGDLDALLENQPRRVLLSREEYEDLLKKAKKSPETPAPQEAALVSAQYEVAVEEDRARWNATITVDVFAKGLHAVPLDLSGLGLRQATLGDKPAPIGRGDDGRLVLLVEGTGPKALKLEMVSPLETTAATQVLKFRVPLPPAVGFRMSVAGDVEVKSGADVVSRAVDETARLTRFELLLRPGDTSLVMTLNSRLQREQRAVAARSVLVDEITEAYEQLHATVSLEVLHRAVDGFRFVAPDGFDILEVRSPLLARWAIETEGGQRLLNVRLREQTVEPVVLGIVAQRTPPKLDAWTMPKLEPLDVVSHVAVVGLVVEQRLRTQSVAADGLIPIDTSVLTQAIPESVLRQAPGAPAVSAVVAYYAPQPKFDLSAQFAKPPAKLSAVTNVLLAVEDRALRVRGGALLSSDVEKLFGFDLSVPAGWHITSVTGADAKPLKFERCGPPDQPARIRVRLPQAVAAREDYRVYFEAENTPAGWLAPWQKLSVEFPVFVVAGAEDDIGALAVDVRNDLAVRPEKLDRLTPLDEAEKGRYGLAGVETDLAYRYDGRPYQATLTFERTLPYLTARTWSFLRVEPDALSAHYEIAYQVQDARTDRLILLLPETTPEMLSIRGLDGLLLKEQIDRGVENGRRRWEVLLAQPQREKIRLAVDFTEPLAKQEPKGLALPIIQAGNVAYQSGLVAVEGTAELHVEVKAAQRARRVDVGELVDAEYQPGRRLLGVFGFVGEPAAITVDVSRHPGYGLDPAIVQRAELLTQLSAEGISQTAALFQLRAKALYLAVQLPPQSALWSADLDSVPIKPQREGESLLVGLPAASADSLRTLRIVYQTPVAKVSLDGKMELAGPQLLLRADRDVPALDVPVADLVWRVTPPPGYSVVRSDGTLTLQASPPAPAAIRLLKGVVGAALWSPGPLFLMSGCGRGASSTFSQTDDVLFHRGEPAKSAEQFGYFEEAAGPMAPPPPAEIAAGREDAVRQVRDPFQPDPMLLQSAVTELEDTAAQSETKRPPPAIAEPVPAQPAAPESKPAAPPSAAQPAPPASQKPSPLQDRLRGVRSLKIDLEQSSETADVAEFQSLGSEPRLVLALANRPRFETLGWALTFLVVLIGFALTDRSALAKTTWILLVLLLGTLIPLVPGLELVAGPANMAVYAAALLVPFYLAIGVIRWFGRLFRRRVTRPAVAAAAITLAVLCIGSPAYADPPKPDQGKEDSRFVVQVVEPPQPVLVPEDAILIPYDPESQTGIQGVDKMLVPYAKYVELWNLAHPDEKLEGTKPPAEFALAGASYSASLASEEFLLLEGQLQVDVFVDKPVTVPLGLEGGVLAKAELDGKPARMSVAQAVPDPPQPQVQQRAEAQAAQQAMPAPRPLLTLHVVGKGRHALAVSVRMRLDRRGGWRVAEGSLPSAPATALTLGVPQPQTEVRLGQVADRPSYETEKADETIQTTLGPEGAIRVEWRPKLSEGQVDRSLTARSAATLDFQEDGLRLVWQLALEFPRSQREQIRVLIPAGYLLEKIAGSNVRGWEVREDGGRQSVDVSLLKAARDRETFELHLSRFAPVGTPEAADWEVPVVAVPDAALHNGQVAIRRSPLLEIRTAVASGVTRTDLTSESPNRPAAGLEESPLGVRAYEAYRFASVPFTIKLAVTPVERKITAEAQTVLRISEFERNLECRVKLNVQNRPLHRIEIFLPEKLKLDEISAPGEFHWALTRRDDRPLLSVYLAGGSQQEVPLLIRGTLGRSDDPQSVALPRIEVVGAERQEGHIAVQVDPAFDVQAVDLKNADTVLLERLFGWLTPEQRQATRLAVHHRGPDYGGTLRLSARQPLVKCETITNVRVTDRAVEETVLLDFTVERAGIRRLSFLLPQSMKAGRIRVPMLREKTIEPAGEGPAAPVRVKLELQDEVMDQLRVLVENDRLLTAESQQAPVPVVETGRTDRRFVVLESAGRDEVVVKQVEGLDPLTRQQQDWQHLTGILGKGITEAYLAGGPKPPRLVFAILERKAWQGAGARIGLSETDLVVDAGGAFRARLVYHLDNTTEQFLAIQMPPGARLWTAQVAGESVKPTKVPESNDPHRVRIPLVKTAPGDLDYEVVLKYGGRMGPLGHTARVRPPVKFPLVRTVNIPVQESHVRLHLPETHRWFEFGGTMGPPVDEADLAAGYVAYQTKVTERLVETMRSADDFAKVRAAANLGDLRQQVQQTQSTLYAYSNDMLQRNVFENTKKLAEAEQRAQEVYDVAGKPVAGDNRKRLNERFAGQKTSRARNVVSEMNRNWDSSSVERAAPADEKAAKFNAGWLEQNRLAREALGKEVAKFTPDQPQKEEGRKPRLSKGKSAELEQRRDASSLGVQQTAAGDKVSGRPGPPPAAAPEDRPADAVARYQEKLKQQVDRQPE